MENTADEVIKAQDKHLREVVAGGDETHNSGLKEMKVGGGVPCQEWRGIGTPSVILLLFPKSDRYRRINEHYLSCLQPRKR
jgi:hypothetical protein